ncbi:DUF1302 domain-containing protein [Pseudomonas sp. LS44]|uniref:DUF1302 domain-containing protein n=1 Tax=Pseudomonas sp. LS44 TaxID=1357074 RepID=UPI00215B1E84|nr:DUF1302 domain-containing protein [Pseudomonas sp. LS44]UVE17452.1 DUF1302 domain-containing protein [Pseudomonas sp. LS44]
MINKNNKSGTGPGLPSFQVASLAVAIALVSSPAWSGETIEFDNGTTIDWTLTTSYGMGVRLSDQDKDLLTVNADDGDRNFDKGSLTTNRVGALGEMIVRKDNYGAVLRASTFYDDVYHQKNDNDSPATVNKTGAHDEFTSDTKYYSGGRSKFLDAYVFGGWRFENDSMLDMKAGRHVESWGEGLFYSGVNGVQSHADAVKAAQPGVEIKEVLLPVGQVSANYRFNPQIGVSAYYQYEWKGTELPPVGSYLSTSDVVGPGREFIFGQGGSRINYAGADEPRDDGQWGVQVRYRPVPAWEVALFHVNYHDKNPATALVNYRAVPVGGGAFAGAPSGYNITYFEDIKLTGLSASTKFGDVQVGAEWSYRDGVPVMVNTGLGATPARGKGQQMQLSAIRILGDRPWASQTSLTAEIVHVRVDSVEDTSAAPNLLALGNRLIPQMRPLVQESDDYTYKTAAGWRSQDASAFTVGASFSYPGVFEGWDLEVPFNFSNVFSGAAPMGGTISGAQGDRRFSAGTTFKYLGNFEVAMRLIGYLGEADPVKRQLADRDYATLALKYSF